VNDGNIGCCDVVVVFVVVVVVMASVLFVLVCDLEDGRTRSIISYDVFDGSVIDEEEDD
jgi:hypothetical protein